MGLYFLSAKNPRGKKDIPIADDDKILKRNDTVILILKTSSVFCTHYKSNQNALFKILTFVTFDTLKGEGKTVSETLQSMSTKHTSDNYKIIFKK